MLSVHWPSVLSHYVEQSSPNDPRQTCGIRKK